MPFDLHIFLWNICWFQIKWTRNFYEFAEWLCFTVFQHYSNYYSPTLYAWSYHVWGELTVSDQLRLKMAMILYSTFLVAPSVKQNLSTIIWGKSMPIGDLHNNVFSRHTHFIQFEFCFRNSVGSRSKIPFFSLWFACLVAKWYLQF